MLLAAAALSFVRPQSALVEHAVALTRIAISDVCVHIPCSKTEAGFYLTLRPLIGLKPLINKEQVHPKPGNVKQ